MITVFGTLTIGSSAVRIASSEKLACKLMFQVAPAAEGNVLVGGAGLANDGSTPAVYLSPNDGTNKDGSLPPGQAISWEMSDGRNVIDVSQFYIHGTNSGDKVNYTYSYTV